MQPSPAERTHGRSITHRHLGIALLALGALFLAAPVQALALAPEIPAGGSGALQKSNSVRITSAEQFDVAHGVRSGSGTAEDPFVISGLDVGSLVIKDTDAYVTITDNVVGRLVLDWIGDRLQMRNNSVGDLRVNQNVRRTGLPTSGVIEHNTFGKVGQLRHWDGVFQHNTVGAPANDSGRLRQVFPSERAVNFDGFNGAVFAHNVIYGYMDARLHGHHHSSGFGENSHNHAAGANEVTDHSQRYHEVWITNNKIHANSRYGLAYLDTVHPANDRTAPSERNRELNKPHVHHTRVHVSDNELIGSGIAVIKFNAQDRRHTGTTRGLVEITGNRISLVDRSLTPLGSPNGISAEDVQDVMLHIAGNVVDVQPNGGGGKAAAVLLEKFDLSDVHLCDNTAKGSYYGVRAANFTDSVNWVIQGLQTEGVSEDVSWDQSVQNEPQRYEAAAASPCGGAASAPAAQPEGVHAHSMS